MDDFPASCMLLAMKNDHPIMWMTALSKQGGYGRILTIFLPEMNQNSWTFVVCLSPFRVDAETGAL